MNLFRKSKQALTSPVPTDTVIPFHYFDDQTYARALVMHFTYCFDDVLDADTLKRSLERVLEMQGWRKLGARVRLNADGKLEYHLPGHYTPERPAFNYTEARLECSIDKHEVARKLPRGGGSEPILFEDPKTFTSLLTDKCCPTKLDDWLYTDKAPLSVHVVTFTDATMLTLSFSHSLLDAIGRRELLTAWTAVLNGREHDVPPFQGFDEDPLAKLDGRTPAERSVLYSHVLRGLGFLVFVFWMIWERMMYPKQSSRVVCLPGSYVKLLREQVLQELAAPESALAADKKDQMFVSEGDVLYAWMAKISMSALKPTPSTPLTLMNVVNYRGLVDDVLPPHQAYTGNATMVSATFLTAGELLRQSIARTALAIRRSLERQRTPEQAQAYVSLQKQEIARTGHGPAFGAPNMLMLAFSNWHKARFFDFDFSGAVVRSGVAREQGRNGRGKPSYVSVMGHENGFSIRNAGGVVGKDAAGDWWLHFAMRDGVWKEFDKQMKAFKIVETS